MVCPPSPITQRAGIWAAISGHFVQDRREPHLLRDRTIPEALLIYCVRGDGSYRLGSREYAIETGDLFHIPVMQSHGYWSGLEGWDIWWVHYGGDHACHLTNLAGLSASTPVKRIGIQAKLIEAFDDLSRVMEQASPFQAINSADALHRLLLELLKPGIHATEELDAMLQAVHRHLNDLDEAAAAAGYSKFHFCRQFKELTSVPPWTYVLQQRLAQAQAMLLEGNTSIKEIARESGFSNADYFSRYFRKTVGMTPTRYRSMHGVTKP